MAGSKHPQSKATRGLQPFETRLRPPSFVRLSHAELNALFNIARHELAGTTYLILIGGSVLSGKSAGHFLGDYDGLRALLRPPKPERGQWAPAPSLKRVRNVIAALEAAGLVERDKESNRMQGQLRLWLSMRKSSP